MKISSRLCTSLDGCVTNADGWPVQLAYPAWDAGQLGFYEHQARCDAVLMGRTTFEPALGAPHWPWVISMSSSSAHAAPTERRTEWSWMTTPPACSPR